MTARQRDRLGVRRGPRVIGRRGRRQIGILAACSAEALYGGSYAFTKQVTNHVEPMDLLAWRFGLSFVIMLLLVASGLMRVRWTRQTVRPLLVLAAFLPVAYYLSETFGIQLTTASESGLLLASIPIANLVAAVLILRRPPLLQQVFGILVTFSGVVLTIWAAGRLPGAVNVGYLLIGLAVLSFAMYTVLAERYADAGDEEKTFVMVAAGALVFGALAFAQRSGDGSAAAFLRLPVQDPAFALAIAYLSLGCTVGAFFLQNVAISILGATGYSTFVGISSGAALVTGAVFLGERLGPLQFLGGAAIIAGVYLANRPTGRCAPEAAGPSPAR